MIFNLAKLQPILETTLMTVLTTISCLLWQRTIRTMVFNQSSLAEILIIDVGDDYSLIEEVEQDER